MQPVSVGGLGFESQLYSQPSSAVRGKPNIDSVQALSHLGSNITNEADQDGAVAGSKASIQADGVLQHGRRKDKDVRIRVNGKHHCPGQRSRPNRFVLASRKLTPHHNGQTTPRPDSQTSLRCAVSKPTRTRQASTQYGTYLGTESTRLSRGGKQPSPRPFLLWELALRRSGLFSWPC